MFGHYSESQSIRGMIFSCQRHSLLCSSSFISYSRHTQNHSVTPCVDSIQNHAVILNLAFEPTFGSPNTSLHQQQLFLFLLVVHLVLNFIILNVRCAELKLLGDGVLPGFARFHEESMQTSSRWWTRLGAFFFIYFFPCACSLWCNNIIFFHWTHSMSHESNVNCNSTQCLLPKV